MVTFSPECRWRISRATASAWLRVRLTRNSSAGCSEASFSAAVRPAPPAPSSSIFAPLNSNPKSSRNARVIASASVLKPCERVSRGTSANSRSGRQAPRSSRPSKRMVFTAPQAWGAVNTILFEGRDERGAWRPLRELAEVPRETRSHGFNTDAEAITRALREDLGLELSGAKILLLGAGGAGRTAALKLASEHLAELFLVNRTRSKAEGVAQEIRQRHSGLKVTIGYPAGPVDLVDR